MADSRTERTRRHTWGQIILGAFVLSWLSVSLQPCLMAMEMEHGQAMTIESGHSSHAAHGEHTASMDADADCEHCPPAICEIAGSCDVAMSPDCQPDVQSSLDSRRTNIVIKDAQFDLPIGIAAAISVSVFAEHKIESTGLDFASRVPGSQPLLNLLNCVFLI